MHTEINLEVPKICYKVVPQGGVLSTLLCVATTSKNLSPGVFNLDFANGNVMYLITGNFENARPILKEAVALVIDNLLTIG